MSVSPPLSLTLSRKGSGNNDTPKRCFRGSIDGACLQIGIYSEFTSRVPACGCGSLFGLMPEEGGDVSSRNSSPDAMLILVRASDFTLIFRYADSLFFYRITFIPFPFRYSFTCRMVNVLK